MSDGAGARDGFDPDRRHAVVVGAGIGGLAAAVGLDRAGWQVTVLEQAPAAREAGAGLSLLTNAQRALDRLGVGDTVRACAASMAPGGDGLRTRSGRRLQAPPDPAFWREHGLDIAVLTRPDLHGALRFALPRRSVRTGCEVLGAESTRDGATVTYRTACGERTLSGDVVVAADGAYSRIRAALWPRLPGPVYSGHSVWRGIAEGVDGDAEPGGSTWGPGAEFGRMPLTGGRIYWFAVANTPEGTRYSDEYAEVTRRFGTWHDPIPALIAATPPAKVLRHDVFELPKPLPCYTAGRVVLLGDAAHLMTSDLGQGACQALEDAAVLCAELAGDDVDRALTRYDEQRRERSQLIAAASHRMGEFKLTERRWERLRRDVRLRLASSRPAREGVVGIGDWTPPAIPERVTVAR
ncbi:Aurachin C monooxygenase/isomerase [Streptomyces sp. RB5]|uniref:Aurachin C monooxygenase/isomerase n=1 Tax=Streptomyces smaragdinus TaxID=2585196 RepID=A0A7K0CDR4_9ACTN|nr:FAD-dependent monooxygenase [Streptomyces smaragdinus]MQY11605.1 Aurachin C monooxygenase/isomerase [Streptomyces smaragdinus]